MLSIQGMLTGRNWSYKRLGLHRNLLSEDSSYLLLTMLDVLIVLLPGSVYSIEFCILLNTNKLSILKATE